MQNERIVIEVSNSIENLLCLGPSIEAIREKNPDTEIIVVGDSCLSEAAHLIRVNLVQGIQSLENDTVFRLDPKVSKLGCENQDWKATWISQHGLDFSNPFHSIDILKKVTNNDTSSVDYKLASMHEYADELPTNLTSSTDLRVTVCLASMELDDLNAILQAVSDDSKNLSLFFLGTLSDRKKAQLLIGAWSERIKMVDLCGKLSLIEQSESCRLSDIAICGPGSVALLSSGHGTFTFCIDRKNQKKWLPYGHGHLLIQPCDSENFHSTLRSFFTESFQYISSNSGQVPTLDDWQKFADDRISNYLGRIRLFGCQRVETLVDKRLSMTELQFRPLLYMGSNPSDITQNYYRLLWEHENSNRSISTTDLSLLHQSGLPFVTDSLKPLEQMYELANFGRKYASMAIESLKKGGIYAANQESNKLQEIEELFRAVVESQPLLQPILNSYLYRQHSVPNLSAIEIAQTLRQEYVRIQEQLMVLLDLSRTLFHTSMSQLSDAQHEENSNG